MLELFVNKRLNIRWERVVLRDQIGELVDDNDMSFRRELVSEIFEGVIPTVDAWDTIVEGVGDLFN
ncbi:hypothetical protein C494_15223 [Natronorubrum bangense JCM 10635]|uniref:Uncharacterized protein n=1 Tax=Natronorubrum bangense JCM 10635 TaxID=1227500 RepID=L9W813_9EURY|nr:hypothetical protein C494_15223 [Natronorubrum bangense JCM 10635]